MKISDILLLPKKLYDKLTGKRHTLVLGIILVGVADMLFTLYQNQTRLLTGKAPVILYFNITLAVVVTILVGLIDVLFFSLPLFDLFKRFKREKSVPNEGELLVKFMKVYICANFLVFPISTLFNFLFSNQEFVRNPVAGILYYAYLIGIPLWISLAVAKGTSVIYGLPQPLKKMAFLATFIWSSILFQVIGYVVDRWFMTLFR